MIIECNNCNKQFEVSSKLIPNEGRLLQCSSCNHKWHFKKKIKIKEIQDTIDKKIKIEEKNIKKTNNKKKINILNYILIFIISFIAIIILVDTFKNPISSFIPSIDFFLQNLYETIKDIYLFFKDLI
tara:strand:- start:259 stop:639 length:381 start_codon:yes stop_codon:yes gene_type:complete